MPSDPAESDLFNVSDPDTDSTLDSAHHPHDSPSSSFVPVRFEARPSRAVVARAWIPGPIVDSTGNGGGNGGGSGGGGGRGGGPYGVGYFDASGGRGGAWGHDRFFSDVGIRRRSFMERLESQEAQAGDDTMLLEDGLPDGHHVGRYNDT